MAIKNNKYFLYFMVFAISALTFVLFTLPFNIFLSIGEITEMRPNSALTPVLGMIFGLPAALGCAVGNLISDLYAGYELQYAVLDMFPQIIYAMVPYQLWRKLNPEQESGFLYRLDSLNRLLKFFLIMLIDAVMIVIFTSLLNRTYSITHFLSFDTFFLFLNSFDSGILFGCPLLIAGNLLYKKIENLKHDRHDKIVTYSLNERMIMNTILTGLGLCFIIGLSIYISDQLSAGSSSVGVWTKVYLFETMALNFYFMISLGFMHFTETKIAKPIEKLAVVAENYYAGTAVEIHRDDMLRTCQQYAGDDTEVGNLARSYIAMVSDLESYMENLQNVVAEKERINTELSLASDIQAHMLPCLFPAFPEYDEFDVYATMTPAKEVGGDFYDFFMVDDTHLAVVMADVSGKGVPAALFMVIGKTLIKNHAQMKLEPKDIMMTVNNLLCEGNENDLFITAWVGLLDLTTGIIQYANAGHNPPLLLQNDENFVYLKSRPGFVLGGMENVVYRQNELQLQPGDRLFLYTDGVPEAMDTEEEMYGEDRLLQYINQNKKESAISILHGLKEDVDTFVGEAPQFDDITMLLLDYQKRTEQVV